MQSTVVYTKHSSYQQQETVSFTHFMCTQAYLIGIVDRMVSASLKTELYVNTT